MDKKFKRKAMSVPEMRRLLGLGRTESYWLLKQGHFKYVCNEKTGRKIRILLDSFEEWYANQFHYHKVIGDPPGGNWTSITYSVNDLAAILGLSTGGIYGILEKEDIKTIIVSGQTRIYIDSFEKWYLSQYRYRKVKDDNHPGRGIIDQTLSTREAADILGISRNNLYTRMKKYGITYVKVDGRLRIMKDSFFNYLNNQIKKED